MFDLHVHLGGAIPVAVLWEILCDSGLKTEFGTFEALQAYLSVQKDKIKSLDDFLSRYFHVTELIQSSTQGAHAAIYQAVAKAYRRSRITGIEIRYNPLKRIRAGVHSLDSIILATLQGLQRASLHYQLKTGILFSMGKEQSLEENANIIGAAIAFYSKASLVESYGVVGIDMAGPESLKKDTDRAWLKQIGAHVEKARTAGLGITWHIGETPYSGPDGLEAVIEIIRPHRLGHGIELRKARGEQKKRLCERIRADNICLELCPSVNLVTRSIESLQEIADLIRMLSDEGIAFCLNTDNPYLINTNLQQEYDQMARVLGPDAHLLKASHAYALKHSFMKE